MLKPALNIEVRSELANPLDKVDLLQTSLRRFLPAALCSLAFALCWFASRPYVEVGINDDWSYIRTAQVFAQTGHITYNGWATAMLGWQVLLGGLFIKLFGFSFTVVRLSMLPVVMGMAFLLQRTFVRAGLREWNATLATLTMTLSPLFLSLATEFMTDVPGFFVIVLCLYACFRTVQAATVRTTIAWLCFAAVSNALGGTVRQIAWLGALVMVPCTLWLVRRRPRVLLVGVPVLIASAALIFGFLHWFQQQPYSVPESLVAGPVRLWQIRVFMQRMIALVIELPLFLLPILLVFVPAPQVQARRKTWQIASRCFAIMLLLAALLAHSRLSPGLEPVLPNYVTPFGLVPAFPIHGHFPIVLNTAVRIAITALVFCAVLGLVVTLFTRRSLETTSSIPELPISWGDLWVILLPFSMAYVGLLLPRALYNDLFDRYLLALILVALIFVVRLYQEQIRPQLPISSLVLVALVALYSVAGTHDLFAMYRARLAAAQQIRTSGVPATSIDGGFEYNAWTQLEQRGFINEAKMRVPAGAFKPVPVHAWDDCHPIAGYYFPAVSPRYSLSFDPDVCLGRANFPAVVYRTWLPPRSMRVYVIRYPGGE